MPYDNGDPKRDHNFDNHPNGGSKFQLYRQGQEPEEWLANDEVPAGCIELLQAPWENSPGVESRTSRLAGGNEV